MNYEQLKSVAIQLGTITVEDCRRYTLLELVYKIANKVNEIIETWVKVETDILINYEELEKRVDENLRIQNEKINWMLNEGLIESVLGVFGEWLLDGTFDRLINQTALKGVNDRIDETNLLLSQMSINVHNYRDLVVDNDWTDAINKAIEVATSAPSMVRRVYLPAGEYLTQGIALPSNITFFGAGKKQTIVKLIRGEKTAPRKCLVTNNDWDNSNTNIYISDMTLDYNGAYTIEDKVQKGNGLSCLLFAHVSHSTIKRVYAKNGVIHCIDISSKEYDPEGCDTNQDFRPFRSSHVLVEGCEAEGAGDDNITTHHSDYITIKDCYSHDPIGTSFGTGEDGRNRRNTNCIEVDDGSRFVTVENCLSVGGYAGFEVKAHNTAPAASNVRLVNCTAINNVRSFVCRHILEEEVTDKIPSTSAFYVDIIGCTAISPSQNDCIYYGAEAFALRIYKYNNVNVSNFTAIGKGLENISKPIYITNHGRHINLNNINISGFSSAETDLHVSGSESGAGKVNINNIVIRNSAKCGIYTGSKELSITNVKMTKDNPVDGSIGIKSGVNTIDVVACVIEGYENMYEISGNKINVPHSRLKGAIIVGSSSGIVENDVSAVIGCTSNSKTSGSKTVVMASSGGEASGERSSLLATSDGCMAMAQKSVIMSSSSSTSKAVHNNVTILSSKSVESQKNYTVIGGYGSEQTATPNNIKWELNSMTGDIKSVGTITGSSSFADFAEMFENKEFGEIPVGTIVALDGSKVIKATGDDMLGVVSKTAVLVAGDSTFSWQGRYLKDEFGGIIYEETEVINEDGEKEVLMLPIESHEYNMTLKNVPRSERKNEWSCVGLIGQVYVRIMDGVNVGDYLTAHNGMGMKSMIKTNLRVMKITKEFDGDYGIAICILK